LTLETAVPHNASRLPDGRTEIKVDTLECAFLIVQASTDLENWFESATGSVNEGVLAFTDANPHPTANEVLAKRGGARHYSRNWS
jgi:hypothetical protein